MRGERVIVGMSGGVDSSVAAALLVDAGADVVGVTMRVWARHVPIDASSRFGSCCGSEAIDDARRVAASLGIPYYLLDMADEFDRSVIGPFVESYRWGRTPVPCVACNTDLKFGSLLARARAWEASAIATGHYARVDRDPDTDRWRLRRARDLRKDQSDFLWPLTQAQLGAARFPVGELTKGEVRSYARRLGLATADKPESQEICFVPGDYRDFLTARDPAVFRPGAVVDLDGRRLGSHAGIAGFTIGQRKGLGLTDSRPLYVVDIDAESDRVTVGTGADLERDRLEVGSANFIAGELPGGPLRVTARIRHNHEPAPATIRSLGHGRAEVIFDAPQRAITPGQSCVWYRGDEVLGGGVIERPDR